ncbi:MAG: hypothetical protein KY461_12610, partial [Actinobacteria bacterium]|nr:hypothetical protein [Actinomycetota bacterium]
REEVDRQEVDRQEVLVVSDRLDPLREELEAIGQVPLEDRAQVFERAHQALVAELNALEEV